MKKTTVSAFLPLLVLLSTLLGGCGGFSASSLWPFDGGAQERSRTPAGAVAYDCEGSKRLYVRYMDNGAYAWVILPERQFRLDKAAAASGARYSNSKATLEVAGDTVTLSDGPTVSYTGCKVPKPSAGPKETQGDKKS